MNLFIDLKDKQTCCGDSKIFLTLLACILIASNRPKNTSFKISKISPSFFSDFQFLGLQKVSLNSTKNHEIFDMESKHMSFFELNIGFYVHGQVTLLIFDNSFPNTGPVFFAVSCTFLCLMCVLTISNFC